jgi:transposase
MGKEVNLAVQQFAPARQDSLDTKTTPRPLRYHPLPKQVARQDFNRYIAPHLSRPVKGPVPKLSLYQIFNYILYVLHTGIQWNQLQTRRNELHWSNVYKWHNRWCKDGSYLRLFAASVMHLRDTAQLDTSRLHGDGSNTVVKKGERGLATRATSTRRGKKS